MSQDSWVVPQLWGFMGSKPGGWEAGPLGSASGMGRQAGLGGRSTGVQALLWERSVSLWGWGCRSAGCASLLRTGSGVSAGTVAGRSRSGLLAEALVHPPAVGAGPGERGFPQVKSEKCCCWFFQEWNKRTGRASCKGALRGERWGERGRKCKENEDGGKGRERDREGEVLIFIWRCVGFAELVNGRKRGD